MYPRPLPIIWAGSRTGARPSGRLAGEDILENRANDCEIQRCVSGERDGLRLGAGGLRGWIAFVFTVQGWVKEGPHCCVER